MPAFSVDEFDNPVILDAVQWHVKRTAEIRHQEQSMIADQVLLLDALATMLAPTLLKDGEKIAQIGMLAHLKLGRTRRPTIAVDAAKIPDVSKMVFV